MARIEERIDRFVTGVVSAPSATDIKIDSAQYSLDVEPSDEAGRLKGRKADTTEVVSVDGTSFVHIDTPDEERDVLYYNPTSSKLYSIKDFYGTPVNTDLGIIVCELTSPSMQVTNFETHIGVGSTATAIPKWAGYIQTKQFGNTALDFTVEDARLLPPVSLTDVQKVVADDTNLYFIEWGGDRIYTWDISIGEWVAPTGVRFRNIRSIALAHNGTNWETFNPSNSFLWVVADDDNGTFLYKLNRSTHEIVQRNFLETDIGADYNYSDLIEVGGPKYLWFSTFVSDGVIDGTHNIEAGKTAQSGAIYKIATPTADGNASPVLARPYLGRTGAGSATGEWVDGGGGVAMALIIGPQIFYKPIFSDNYVGVVASIHELNGSGFVDTTTGAVLMTGGTPSTNTSGTFRIALHYNTVDNELASWTSTTCVSKLEDASIDNSPLSGSWDIPIGCTEISSQTGDEFIISTGDVAYADTTGNLVAFDSWNIYHTPSNAWGLDATIASAGSNTTEIPYATLARSAEINQDEFNIYQVSMGDYALIGYDSIILADAWLTSGLYTRGDIKLTSTSLGTGDLNGTVHWYGVSWLYDGFQESPLNSLLTQSDGDTEQAIAIEIFQAPARATHINIYRADSDQVGALLPNQYSRLLKSVKLDSTWTHSIDAFLGTHYEKTVNDNDNLGASYDALVGISETLDTFTPHYEISSSINSALFIGRCHHDLIGNAMHYIFRSKPFKFDQYNWLNDYLILPEIPIGMRGFNGRLYVWSANNMYRINPEGMYVEDTYEGFGIASNQAATVTDFGLLFVDSNNIYIHDGTNPKPLGLAISKMQNSAKVGWEDMTHTSGVYTSYDSPNGRFIIATQKSTTGYAFVYTLALGRWDIWTIDVAQGIFSDDSGVPHVSDGTSLKSIATSATRKPFTFVSKISGMGDLTTIKQFRRFKYAYDGSTPTLLPVIFIRDLQSGWGSPSLVLNSAMATDGVVVYDIVSYSRGNSYYMKLYGHANGTTEIDATNIIASARLGQR